MRRILEINDADIGLKTEQHIAYKPRTAARAILRKGGLIALLNVSKHGYYKLPGGGVDAGETIQDALKREIFEEVGCTFRVVDEVGEIMEYRSQRAVVQTSYCFMAEVEKEGKTHFTKEELQDGFELTWVTFDNAICLLSNSKRDTYNGKFIVKREIAFLEQARKYFK